MNTLIFLFLVCSGTQAGDESSGLFSVSLDELLTTRVKIAATRDETITETPAVVSSYRIEDLMEMGITNIADLLDFIPSVVVQDSHIGTTQVAIRGLSENFNQKVLFLIDDIPYWMPSHSDIPLYGIPFRAIEKIEIIRGPGAIYYGTNASAGVIKVITRKDKTRDLWSWYGTNETWNAGGYLYHALNRGGLTFSFEAQGGDGYRGWFPETLVIPPFSEDTPTSGFLDKAREHTTFMARLEQGNFVFLAQSFRSQNNGLGGAPVIVQPNEIEYEGDLIHGHYRLLRQNRSLEIFTDFNRFLPEIRIDNFFDGTVHGTQHYRKHNYRWRSGTQGEYRYNRHITWLAGLEHEVRYVDEYVAVSAQGSERSQAPSERLHETSLYSQVDIKNDHLRFLAGARHTHNSESGNHLSPRLSLVYQAREDASLKLLYSEGFNSPNVVQRKIDIPFVIKGRDTLQPEIVKTIDLAWSFVRDKMLFVANIYYLKTEEIIERPEIDGVNTYTNIEGFERRGCEIDFQMARTRWKLFSNLAYNNEGNRERDNDPGAINVPRWEGSIGLRHRVYFGQSLGLSVRYLGERNQADALIMANLAYTARVGRAHWFLNLKNLTNEEIAHPDVANNRIPLIPGGPGFTIDGGCKFRF